MNKMPPLASAISKVIADKFRHAAPKDLLEMEDSLSPDYAPTIRLDNQKLPHKTPKTRPEIDAVLVKAQNVHDYYVAHHKDHGWKDVKNFFAVRPPFPKMVITYTHAFLQPENNDALVDRHVCVRVTERDFEYFSHYLRAEANIPSEGLVDLRRVVDAVRPDFFLEARTSVDTTVVPGRWFVMLDERGQVLTHENYGWIFVKDPQEDAWINQSRLPNPQEVVQNFFGRHGSIALATLQFMNCKNVEVVDNHPNHAARKLARREGRPEPVSYKTLVIHPMGAKRRVVTRSDGSAVAGVALHIVRGHFKDYREGFGLGRSHTRGVWWWAPQVRGSEDIGRVVKDYEVDSR